jgi:small subunit ribosomal protein S20
VAAPKTAVERASRRRCARSSGLTVPRVGSASLIDGSFPESSEAPLVPSRGPETDRSVAAPFRMANIKQQKKRVETASRQRLENLRYRSTIKTLAKRLERAVEDGDGDRVTAEHRELVRTIDRAVSRGALHRNTAARKKSQAARVVAGA